MSAGNLYFKAFLPFAHTKWAKNTDSSMPIAGGAGKITRASAVKTQLLPQSAAFPAFPVPHSMTRRAYHAVDSAACGATLAIDQSLALADTAGRLSKTPANGTELQTAALAYGTKFRYGTRSVTPAAFLMGNLYPSLLFSRSACGNNNQEKKT